ncbi:hypothetical protein ABFS83_06G071200 [Erythranthe nasuta]
MKAASVTYLFLVISLLLLIHIDPAAQSTANHHSNNPRYDRMLRGRQPSPPPPIFGRQSHQKPPLRSKVPDPDTIPPPTTGVVVDPPPPPPPPPPPGPSSVNANSKP